MSVSFTSEKSIGVQDFISGNIVLIRVRDFNQSSEKEIFNLPSVFFDGFF